MAGNVWVLAEGWRGRISDVTFELLALGRELAAHQGASLEAVLLGHNARELAGALGAADAVLYVDHLALAEPSPDGYGSALATLLQERKPQALLVPLTNVLWDEIGALPAWTGWPLVNSCRDVHCEDGRWLASCVLYGGKMEVTVAVPTPAILGILSGARSADAGRAEKAPAVEEVRVELQPSLVEFQGYREPEAGDVDITKQDVLVSIGRGIQTQDNVALAEELAQALGGAVSGSRPVIDQGWLPASRQVGKSGMHVKPKLYLALGISGAPEHKEGMKDSELIIAVNTDPAAPIFHIAQFGVCADLFDIVPALTEEARKRKVSRAA